MIDYGKLQVLLQFADGTLIDSMTCWCNLAGEYLKKQGIEEVPEYIIEKIKPMTVQESAELFLEEFGISGTAESIAAEMDALMEEHYRSDIPLKPGVVEYLEALHKKGVRMCVASATAEYLMEVCLTRLGVRCYFEFLLSCETVGAGKSRPDVYMAAAARLGSAPAETVVYEDALYAAQTAKKAGFYTIGVYDISADGNWEKLTQMADEVIRSF